MTSLIASRSRSQIYQLYPSFRSPRRGRVVSWKAESWKYVDIGNLFHGANVVAFGLQIAQLLERCELKLLKCNLLLFRWMFLKVFTSMHPLRISSSQMIGRGGLFAEPVYQRIAPLGAGRQPMVSG